MPLSWNEIRSRALVFSKHWMDAARVAFLFARYQALTSLLPAQAACKKSVWVTRRDA